MLVLYLITLYGSPCSIYNDGWWLRRDMAAVVFDDSKFVD